MEIVNRVPTCQNHQISCDFTAQRPESLSENSDERKVNKENSVIVLRLRRHDDHAE